MKISVHHQDALKYMRVCPICQRPRAVNLSSHLEMVHGLNANECTNRLKQAILCPPTPLIQARRYPIQQHRAKLKKIRQDRRVVELSKNSSDKTPTSDMLPEPYLTAITNTTAAVATATATATTTITTTIAYALYCHRFVFFMLSLFNTVSLTALIYHFDSKTSLCHINGPLFLIIRNVWESI